MKLFLVPILGTAMLTSGLALSVPMPAWAQDGPIPLLPAPAPRSVTAGSVAANPSNAIADSLRTTTDSAEYCTELHGRVDHLARDAKTPTAEQALSLSQEGERLCKHGQTRSGILHLRRAFILIRPPEAAREAGR